MRCPMLTFRIAITAAVMTFITVLAACLIFIQIATFDLDEYRNVRRPILPLDPELAEEPSWR